MKKILIVNLTIISFLFCFNLKSQTNEKYELTIKKIMQGDNFVGHLPHNIHWSENSEKIFFSWNPEDGFSDSLYSYKLSEKKTKKLSFDDKWNKPSIKGIYNKDKSLQLYSKNGDIFILNISNNKKIQVTNTIKQESNPYFIENDSKVVFTCDNNIFTWKIETGQLTQLSDFRKGDNSFEYNQNLSQRDKWLKEDQLKTFNILKKRNEKRKAKDSYIKKRKLKRPLPIYLKGKNISNTSVSYDGKFIIYTLVKRESSKMTNVPDFVTESGYTENISSRPKVGQNQSEYRVFIYDIEQRKIFKINIESLEGVDDKPDFLKDYPNKKTSQKSRIDYINGPTWSPDGKEALFVIKSADNKDRWIALLDFENYKFKTIVRQHDDAWIGGPGISFYSRRRNSMGWMPDNKRIWYQSEKTGYSHLYTVNIKTRKEKQLTKGKFEIYNPKLSIDNNFWYFSSNKVHPGEIHFYRMKVTGGNWEKLTNLTGKNLVSLSPDEKKLAIRHSYSNKPWEIYIKDNPVYTENSIANQITYSLKKDFKKYNWRDPKIITFKASDGARVFARLYTPENNIKNKAAVIFVHGAGYMQNAHKGWSSYFREYMFHNFLADKGYTILDIDYRGSAGYGRDWRTDIYRHMSGKDLSDQIDGTKYLIKEHNIDPERIGIYGGSYGGFITLMAMFKTPDVFAAGAAMRSVTDWAHYNHYYSSKILNTPVTDSLAYVKSSPIYYADGLKGALLILHGMVDDNVHFQDVVRLSQKLIELGKQNWEMALYPVENHGFQEPESWTDEYTRIFNLFQENLLKQ